jgi:hypothetical protein
MKRFCILTGALVSVAVIMAIAACKKDNNNPAPPPSYTVPTTYNFTDADSLNAKTYLSMLGEMEAAINRANTVGVTVSSSQLTNMFANQGNFFTDTVFSGFTLDLNNSGFNLKSAMDPSAQVVVTNILDSVGADSQTGATASNGVAGVSDRKTLLGANGIFWRQFFTKTMMGAFIAHQITDVYLGDSLNSGISVAAKKHAWDQAFFFWCVPSNFPANRTGVKYWGSYTSQIDSGIIKPVTSLTGINANVTLLQAAIIIPFFETMEAAAALHELNEAKGNIPNGAAAVCGNLSESMGFWTALNLNNHKKISAADYQSVLSLYGTNFYEVTPAGIDSIQNKISSIYGWDAIKSNL